MSEHKIRLLELVCNKTNCGENINYRCARGVTVVESSDPDKPPQCKDFWHESEKEVVKV